MIEGLVLQELQNEFQSPIRRDATFSTAGGRVARVDGIIETSAGPIIVEIKMIRPRTEVVRRVREAREQLRNYVQRARETMNPDTSGMMIFVVDGDYSPHRVNNIEKISEQSRDRDLFVKVFHAQKLIEKYGLG